MLNFTWVWNLPFGSGKRYLGSATGVLSQVVGSWRISAIQTYQRGSTIRVTSRATIPGLSGIWPNLNPGVPIEAMGCGAYDPDVALDHRRLNIAAFSTPAPFTLGNSGVLPTVRRCPYLDEHLGIQKDFRFHENALFAIGMQGQNIFNRHYWQNVGTDIGNPAAFGRFTGASYGRTIQLYARIEF